LRIREPELAPSENGAARASQPTRVAMARTSDENVHRWLENRQEELDSAFQYKAMAAGEARPNISDVYRRLAAVEETHAAFWEGKLRDAGRPLAPSRPSVRARLLGFLARRLGAGLVLPTVAASEYVQRNDYTMHPETKGTSMTDQERMHARVLGNVLAQSSGLQGGALANIEGRHRNVGGNALRAAVLGANDGLCSNLSLVMGVAGATVDHHVILLTGLAGLLAGAFSMALGEWVSVSSARELAEREVRIEKSEVEENPDEEREELQLIYESKGLSSGEAAVLSRSTMKDERTALDTLSREELGIDPDELGGSAWTAALASFFLFSVGAIIPVAPFFFVTSPLVSVGVAGAGLFVIGASIALFTGRSAVWSGVRQLVLGFAAAGATYAIGHLIGVAVTG
jgi:VIT1/CCC1 family predicted Fe2+/Mn2+ transporter